MTTRDLSQAEWLTPAEAVCVFRRNRDHWIALARIGVEGGGIVGRKDTRWLLERKSIQEWLTKEPQKLTFAELLHRAHEGIRARRSSAGAGV